MEIMDTSLEGGVFHIVNQRPKTIDELIAYTTRYFNLEGLQAVHTDAFHEKSRIALEILFDTYVEAYKPYMTDARIFNNDKTQSILEKKRHHLPGPSIMNSSQNACSMPWKQAGGQTSSRSTVNEIKKSGWYLIPRNRCEGLFICP